MRPKNSIGPASEHEWGLARPQDAGGLAPAKSENKVQRPFRPLAGALPLVKRWYAWFLEHAFKQSAFEEKKGQRKLPLAQQIYENLMDAFVSGVSLGQLSEVDAPQVNIQYVVPEIDKAHHL